MPKLFAKRIMSRRSAALALSAATAGIGAMAVPATAAASTSQVAMIQDGGVLGDPAATFQQFRELGATVARIIVPWSQIAPKSLSFKKPSFNASDPNAYPASNWAPYDTIVRVAQHYGIQVDFTVTGGAPQWAEARLPQPPGYDPYFAFKPNAAAYGQFMQALGTRYSGTFTARGQSTPLPAVRFWAIFNEPNFGEDLGPQAINGSKTLVAPMMYRNILNAGWKALQTTGHGHDTILVGGFAARGFNYGPPTRHAPQGYPGNFGQTKPLTFIRALYCVAGNYRELRGQAAKSVGCPTTAGASRRFRAQNPALFSASGVGDHPYPDNGSPVNDGKGDPDYATFPDLGNLARVLDRVNRVYGSRKQLPIYNDEYGYITHPPAKAHYLSPATAAYYINWAEYLSWKNPRVKSYMQYLLKDPPNTAGPYAGFASGLENPAGAKKATYFAFNLPVYMPRTSFSRATSAELWGDARPANFEKPAQSVAIQFQKGNKGAFTTLKTVAITKPGGYFDLRMKFPASGSVRLAYTYPSGADADPLLPLGLAGRTILSRSFTIKVR